MVKWEGTYLQCHCWYKWGQSWYQSTDFHFTQSSFNSHFNPVIFRMVTIAVEGVERYKGVSQPWTLHMSKLNEPGKCTVTGMKALKLKLGTPTNWSQETMAIYYRNE